MKAIIQLSDKEIIQDRNEFLQVKGSIDELNSIFGMRTLSNKASF